MDFLVTMTTHVPGGTPEATIDEVRRREANHSSGLASSGTLRRLWRPPLAPGEWRTLGLFTANGADELDDVLSTMPLKIWRTDDVLALSPHPNDPSLRGAGPSQEFLVTMTITMPVDAPPGVIEQINELEADSAHQLAKQGHLQRLWGLPDHGDTRRVVGLWNAGDANELATILAALPLHPWMTVTTTPLSPHPNDPATTNYRHAPADKAPPTGHPTMDMKLEVVVLPVTDVDTAKHFYLSLGWRLDADLATTEDFRVVQLTPPGSPCSIIFGTGITDPQTAPVTGLHLAVADIDAARTILTSAGAEVTDVFHDVGEVFHHAETRFRVPGPQPRHLSYSSFATFSDPDGNGWWLQEITDRLPGRVEATASFTSVPDLADALRRAAAAHGEHETHTGRDDPNWPDWYAHYVFAENTGTEPPE